MRRTEYYLGHHFDPRDAQELTAPQYLIRKIRAGEHMVADLMFVHYMDRDMVRINRIVKAMKQWRLQLDEIYGITGDVE